MVKPKNIVILILAIMPCLSAVAQIGDSGGMGTLIDKRDNKVYRTVKIGGLTWTAENLNVRIDSCRSYDSYHCSRCYNDDSSNCIKYGMLYTWEAAKDACHGIGGGWRLPMNEDWDELVRYAGGANVAGERLKSKSGWENNGNGKDEYGFSATPGGVRFQSSNKFYGAGKYGGWWSASKYGKREAYVCSMDHHYYGVNVLRRDEEFTGHSVRCVAGSARSR